MFEREEAQVTRQILDQVKAYVRDLFEKGTIQAFIGYKREGGHPIPALFKDVAELDALDLGNDENYGDVRYPLSDVCRRLLEVYPDGKIGVLVRGCDERAIVEMSKWNQISIDRLVIVGIACSKEWVNRCGCKKPYPDALIAGTPVTEEIRHDALELLEEKSFAERKAFWDDAFSRCIKCYGCRNICPVCFCKDCSLEDPLLVKPGFTPAEFPIFHLVRAVHMAGRCIDCGLCEETCPADIPLRTLYRKINAIVKEEFGYETGVKDDSVCPLNTVA
ncbi:MAG: 4Fe-4S ferredoxin [Thermodesulforhabdaceae bacterium]